MSKIVTIDSSQPTQAMDTARRALETRGYLWQPQPDGSALAHEKGKTIIGRAMAWRVLIHVEQQPTGLRLERLTDGASGFLFGAAGGITAMTWTNSEFTRAAHDVKTALQP